MQRYLLALGVMGLALPALAQSMIQPSPAYKECVTLAGTNPTKALAKAEEWVRVDNGIAAQHCKAMALFGLGRYTDAADVLSALHDSVSTDNIALRSYLTRQAVQAEVKATQADQALALIAAELDELNAVKGNNALAAKLTAEQLLDRARISVTFGKLPEAATDLDHAVSLTPTNTELLMARAEVFEKLGDRDLAKADAAAVVKLEPGNVVAKQFLARLNSGQ